jgi:D-alanyl-D-alanine carboxypeptidase
MTLIPPLPRKATSRNGRLLVVGLIVVLAVITAAIAGQVPKSSSYASSSPSSPSAPSAGLPIASPPGDHSSPGDQSPPRDHRRADRNGPKGPADGALPDGVTVFDDGYPAVAKLDPELLRAVREAATDAADDGVKLYVNSGWRSPERQNQLLREAVSEYGSAEEAARWVATADTSPHVSGDAIDVGPSEATAWLSDHGAGYGLCQIYRNEPWHYELRTTAIDHGCPRTYADPTQDPRMHQ